MVFVCRGKYIMASLDIIVLLIVVGLLFYKLKSLLGTRPEEHKVHLSKESAEKLYDLLMKETESKMKINQNNEAEFENEPQELEPVVDEANLSETDKVLMQIPNFNKTRFIDNAQNAFQIITEAFNNGDIETLEMLVSKKILKKFQETIEKRKADGIIAETDFICFDKVEIVKADVDKNDNARISVEFVSEQVNVLRDGEGKVLQGDENFIQNITDVWTFERAVNSSSPNWILTSTKK